MARPPRGKRAVDESGRVSIRGRNANGDGSTYFDAANEVWCSTWFDAVGKRRKASGKTRVLAEQRRAARQAAEATRLPGSRFDDATTTRQLADWWLTDVAPLRMRSTSVGTHRERLGHLGNLGPMAVVELTVDQLQTWQAELLRPPKPLAPRTVVGTRQSLNQVLSAAVDVGLIAVNPMAKVHPVKPEKRPGRYLEPDEARRLVAACSASRYGAAVAILFGVGLRVSEVLGIAWADLDLDAGTVTVRRAVVQPKGEPRRLGPPKAAGALGEHHLSPGIVSALRRRKVEQAAERLAAGEVWERQTYEGKRLDLVFATELGGLASRQHVDALLRRKAAEIGIDPDRLGTHVGRRTVVTTLFVDGADLGDIARHVGHGSTATTAVYVASLGTRPKLTAERAARLLDVGDE